MPRIIDLTLTVRRACAAWSSSSSTPSSEHGWNSRTLHLYSHSGTHMDAPLHFDAGDGTIDRIPLEHCLVPAWVADLTGLEPKALITVAHLGPIAKQGAARRRAAAADRLEPHVDDPQYYRDNFPRISEELAEWCVERRGPAARRRAAVGGRRQQPGGSDARFTASCSAAA